MIPAPSMLRALWMLQLPSQVPSQILGLAPKQAD
jgi:hypothetical protein